MMYVGHFRPMVRKPGPGHPRCPKDHGHVCFLPSIAIIGQAVLMTKWKH